MSMSRFSFLDRSANTPTPSQTLRALTYEVGDMNKLFHRTEVYPPERNVYMGDLKGETADALSMLLMFCEHMNWDPDEIQSYGRERYLERQQDIRTYGLREKLRRRNDE